MHLTISTTLKKINFLIVKTNKLKRERQEKDLECENNAQKDKREQDESKSSQVITHKMPKREILVG
jgi:hypothetical protein